VADRAYVMRLGAIVHESTARDLAADAAKRKQLLGA
jgi:ABC-type branched-subunit amino acid transport system ATPase component